jgi:hypothetical protein
MPNFVEECKINHFGYENNLASFSIVHAVAGWLQHYL